MCKTIQKQQKEILSSGPTTSQRIKRGQNLITKLFHPTNCQRFLIQFTGPQPDKESHIQLSSGPQTVKDSSHNSNKYPKTQPTTTQPKPIMKTQIKLTIFWHFIWNSPFSNHFYLSINEVTNAATPKHQIENADTPYHPN